MQATHSWMLVGLCCCAWAVTTGCSSGPERNGARAPIGVTETTGATAATATPNRDPEAIDADMTVKGTPGSSERTERMVQVEVGSRLEQVKKVCGAIPREIDWYETTLHLEVGATGRVEVAEARGSNPIVDACVSDLARGWSLEPAAGRTVANVSLALTR